MNSEAELQQAFRDYREGRYPMGRSVTAAGAA